MTTPSVPLVPVGTVMAYAGAITADTTTTLFGLGWLPCDGTLYSTTDPTYSALFTALQTSCGGSGSSQFAVPDYRGVFLRGVDGGSGHDPDSGSRSPPRSDLPNQGTHADNAGSLQSNDVRSHDHQYSLNNSYGVMKELMDNLWSTSQTAISTTNTGGNESRPPNLYVNYLICFNTGAGFAIPTGVIVPYAGDSGSASALATDGWLACDGSARSNTTYNLLAGVIGTSFGGTSTTFTIDLRGCFLRGTDSGRNRDPDTASRTSPQPSLANPGNPGDAIGSFQTTQLRSHSHNVQSFTTESDKQTQGGTAGPIANSPDNTKFTDDKYQGYSWVTSSTGTGAETRPVNMNVYWLIKSN